MFKYNKQFRELNPQTIGETDKDFDLENYKEWLELKLEKSNDILSDLIFTIEAYSISEPRTQYYFKEELEKARKIVNEFNKL